MVMARGPAELGLKFRGRGPVAGRGPQTVEKRVAESFKPRRERRARQRVAPYVVGGRKFESMVHAHGQLFSDMNVGMMELLREASKSGPAGENWGKKIHGNN
jgi:hypothetical protein